MNSDRYEMLKMNYEIAPYSKQLEFLTWAFGEETMLDVCRDKLYDDEDVSPSDIVEQYEKDYDMTDIVEKWEEWIR